MNKKPHMFARQRAAIERARALQPPPTVVPPPLVAPVVETEDKEEKSEGESNG